MITLSFLIENISYYLTYADESVTKKFILFLKSNFIKNTANDESARRTFLADQIKLFIKQHAVLDKLYSVRVLSDLFDKQTEEPDITRLRELKNALSTERLGWKAACLCPHIKKEQDIHFALQFFSSDTSLPVKKSPNRFTLSGASERSAALVCSTFSSNIAGLKEVQDAHILDAFYRAWTYNLEGMQNDFVFALGDGCGGHFNDVRQDKNISRVAHFAVKDAARILAAYDKPEMFLAEAKQMIKLLADAVKNKVWGENTTLLCARASPIQEGQYHVVGFNIGDGLFAAWIPDEKRILTLSPAIISEYGVAQFSESYKPDELSLIDVNITENSLLFGVSDGFVDSLPTITTEYHHTQTAYRIISLNGPVIVKLLEDSTEASSYTAKQLTDVLLNTVIKQIEQERISSLSADKPFQLGDDVCIVVM